jgi:hypothetical protein
MFLVAQALGFQAAQFSYAHALGIGRPHSTTSYLLARLLPKADSKAAEWPIDTPTRQIF